MVTKTTQAVFAFYKNKQTNKINIKVYFVYYFWTFAL